MLRWLLKNAFYGLGIVIVAISVLVSSTYWTFNRLTYEVPVGSISFQKIADQHFSVTFRDSKERVHRFELQGDEWQLDAHVLKWKPWVILIGYEQLFSLDRVSGRYRDVEQARSRRPSLYSLADKPWLDIWSLARQYPDWFFMLDAQYGSGVYLPMEDGAKYQITMSDTGLLARNFTSSH